MQVTATTSTKRRRAETQGYVTFEDSDQAGLTDTKSSASIFYLYGDFLVTDNELVGSNSDLTDTPLIKSANPPVRFKYWTFPAGVGQVQGAGGFCLYGSTIYVVIDQTTCAQPINLVQQGMFFDYSSRAPNADRTLAPPSVSTSSSTTMSSTSQTTSLVTSLATGTSSMKTTTGSLSTLTITGEITTSSETSIAASSQMTSSGETTTSSEESSSAKSTTSTQASTVSETTTSQSTLISTMSITTAASITSSSTIYSMMTTSSTAPTSTSIAGYYDDTEFQFTSGAYDYYICPDVDVQGNDLGPAQTESYKECATVCNGLTGCAGWTTPIGPEFNGCNLKTTTNEDAQSSSSYWNVWFRIVTTPPPTTIMSMSSTSMTSSTVSLITISSAPTRSCEALTNPFTAPNGATFSLSYGQRPQSITQFVAQLGPMSFEACVDAYSTTDSCEFMVLDNGNCNLAASVGEPIFSETGYEFASVMSGPAITSSSSTTTTTTTATPGPTSCVDQSVYTSL